MRRTKIEINGRKIGEGEPVFVIGEAGVNHNGSVKLAKKLIDMAKSCGADAVKFQTFKTEKLVSGGASKAAYQERFVPGKSQFRMLKDLELSESDFKDLFDYCRKKGIIFLSTPFDSESAKFLKDLGVCAFKISSGDITDRNLLFQVSGYARPVILSTGMSTLSEVKEAVKVIYLAKNKDLILLHCTSNYPAKFEDVNLRAIMTLKNTFKTPVGYSDHTSGIEIAIASAAFGACVIEKHFTLDKRMSGPDHSASLGVAEFKNMVDSIRRIESALGDGIKVPAKPELDVRNVARKSIVSLADIPKGAKIEENMLAFKRPGSGIEPRFLPKVVGRIAKKDILKDQVLSWGLLS